MGMVKEPGLLDPRRIAANRRPPFPGNNRKAAHRGMVEVDYESEDLLGCP
ncbi:hypothetical protein BFJ71_g17882 [Fusarium oxysporum]|nr:hypothetical protein BFJ71_g17882 [Fusarium oxysporum]